ncbi:MAG: OmpA family protein [Actinobacteria bacterium]|jgi:outer membrane protein OmpA-like peptidoglycan-associated protein|nr:OmpA family protein [Actinomycetota bacterium]
MRMRRRGVTLLAGGAVVLAACSGGGDPEDPPTEATETESGEATDAESEDDEEEREEAAPPVSTVTTRPVDAPASDVEIRVAEIIVEFDGEVTDQGTVLTLEEPILFDFDSADLKSSAAGPLDDIAEVLAFYGDAPVEIVGHTDDQGSADYNLDLSRRRAAAVFDALRERGIDEARMSSEGRGFDDPVTSNDTEEGRAQNRRVEVLIVGVEPPDPEN